MLAPHLPASVSICGISSDLRSNILYDAVVIFTCGFIQDAKEESVEMILDWCQRKVTTGNPRRVYVVGCLSQRYADELCKEIPEADGFFGVNDLETVVTTLCGNTLQQSNQDTGAMLLHFDSKPYAFLKLSDGCNHHCTFCIIPAIKGAYHSRPHDILLEEARQLIATGVREINLVAQDITGYGYDLYSDYRLPELLRDLCMLPGDFWIRCLYCYPAGITDDLIEQMATQSKIVPYLDIPLQHASPSILKAMKRPAPDQDVKALINKLREAIPELTLRTTMIVGFPGETEADHEAMLDLVKEIGFEWLGAFQYCPEEGTAAATMGNQVPETVVKERYETLMELQAEITAAFNVQREGNHTRVLVENYDEDLNAWTAHSAAEAPEVDGAVLIYPHAAIQPGAFIEVELLEASLYDITAQVR